VTDSDFVQSLLELLPFFNSEVLGLPLRKVYEKVESPLQVGDHSNAFMECYHKEIDIE